MLTLVRCITIMLCALTLSLGLSQATAVRPDPVLLTTVAALLSAAAASVMILSLLSSIRRPVKRRAPRGPLPIYRRTRI